MARRLVFFYSSYLLKPSTAQEMADSVSWLAGPDWVGYIKVLDVVDAGFG